MIHKEEVRRLAEMRDLGGKREVMNVFQCIVKLCSLVSTILEIPEIVMRVPWSFSLIMIRERVWWSPRTDSYILG